MKCNRFGTTSVIWQQIKKVSASNGAPYVPVFSWWHFLLGRRRCDRETSLLNVSHASDYLYKDSTKKSKVLRQEEVIACLDDINEDQAEDSEWGGDSDADDVLPTGRHIQRPKPDRQVPRSPDEATNSSLLVTPTNPDCPSKCRS